MYKCICVHTQIHMYAQMGRKKRGVCVCEKGMNDREWILINQPFLGLTILL